MSFILIYQYYNMRAWKETIPKSCKNVKKKMLMQALIVLLMLLLLFSTFSRPIVVTLAFMSSNLQKGRFSVRIEIRSDGSARKFIPLFTIQNLLHELHTNYPAMCVSTVLLFTLARLPEMALRPRSYRPRTVWHVIECHYVYHRSRTCHGTSRREL